MESFHYVASNGRPTLGYLSPTVQALGMLQWTGVIDAAREREVNLFCFPGGTFFDFFPLEQVQITYVQEQEIIRIEQPILAVEEFDGRRHWVLTTKMPLRDEHGDILGTFGISRDITPLKMENVIGRGTTFRFTLPQRPLLEAA